MEGFLGKNGSDFTGDTTGPGVFVNDQALISLPDGVEDGFLVERHERAEVDNLGFNTFFGKRGGGFERGVHHRGVGKDG